MKNIKQTIKNKAKATGEFISKNKEIIIPLAIATGLGVYTVLKVKSNDKLIKEVEDNTHSRGYGEGIAQGITYALTNMVDNNELKYKEADDAYNRIDENIKNMLRRNETSLNGYNTMMDRISKEE